MLPRQLCQAAQMAREMDRTKGVQDRKQSAVSKTPPPNPLPATERGRRRETVWLAPPLLAGEGVGGRGFPRAMPFADSVSPPRRASLVRGLPSVAASRPQAGESAGRGLAEPTQRESGSARPSTRS